MLLRKLVVGNDNKVVGGIGEGDLLPLLLESNGSFKSHISKFFIDTVKYFSMMLHTYSILFIKKIVWTLKNNQPRHFGRVFCRAKQD